MTIPEADYRRVWVGKNQEICVSFCNLFRAASISFQVDQHHLQVGKGLDEFFTIYVPVESFGEAKRIIDLDTRNIYQGPRENVEDSSRNAPPPAEKRHSTLPDGQRLTLLVHVAKSKREESSIVMSLGESDIEVRVESESDDARKVYVAPEDEKNAREIIRKIEAAY